VVDVEIRLSARWRALPPRRCSAFHCAEQRHAAVIRISFFESFGSWIGSKLVHCTERSLCDGIWLKQSYIAFGGFYEAVHLAAEHLFRNA
jgi:hypothetical protein